jgi:hypothetical protein
MSDFDTDWNSNFSVSQYQFPARSLTFADITFLASSVRDR